MKTGSYFRILEDYNIYMSIISVLKQMKVENFPSLPKAATKKKFNFITIGSITNKVLQEPRHRLSYSTNYTVPGDEAWVSPSATIILISSINILKDAPVRSQRGRNW